jgi:hypothetical protein
LPRLEAVQYFYEPFLEALDRDLSKQLGVHAAGDSQVDRRAIVPRMPLKVGSEKCEG